VRQRRDADAPANTADDAPADAPADTADAHAHANNQNSRADAHADHRRAGRRSVGYELS
jgi:hypothetical protein